jgi:hypothetical protein
MSTIVPFAERFSLFFVLERIGYLMRMLLKIFFPHPKPLRKKREGKILCGIGPPHSQQRFFGTS